VKRYFIIRDKFTKVYMTGSGYFDAMSEQLAQRFLDTEARRDYVRRNYPNAEMIDVQHSPVL